MYLGGGLGGSDPLPKLKVLGRIITFQSKKNYSKSLKKILVEK